MDTVSSHGHTCFNYSERKSKTKELVFSCLKEDFLFMASESVTMGQEILFAVC